MVFHVCFPFIITAVDSYCRMDMDFLIYYVLKFQTSYGFFCFTYIYKSLFNQVGPMKIKNIMQD